MNSFFFCLNLHQQNILFEKGIHSNIVNASDLEQAILSGAKRIVLFNDTIPDVFKILKNFDGKVELWQEGLIPFFGIRFNTKSTIRILVNEIFPARLLRGLRPYFFNGIDTIRTAYDPAYLRALGVAAKNIIYDPTVFTYRPINGDFCDVPLYLGTDFYSEGMLQDHRAQIKNFKKLKERMPKVKFKPHPKEVDLFRKIFDPYALELSKSFSNEVFGTISTALYLNFASESKVTFILEGHSDIVKRAHRNNVQCLFVGASK